MDTHFEQDTKNSISSRVETFKHFAAKNIEETWLLNKLKRLSILAPKILKKIDFLTSLNV